jgi:hypothetical protein
MLMEWSFLLIMFNLFEILPHTFVVNTVSQQVRLFNNPLVSLRVKYFSVVSSFIVTNAVINLLQFLFKLLQVLSQAD